MSYQIIICITIFILSMGSYVVNKLPMSVTALTTMMLLVFTGCIEGGEALSGFANTNNIVIVSMFVVAAGLNRTRFIDKMSEKIIQISGGSFKKSFMGYLILAFILTNFLNSPLTVFAIVFPMCFAMSEAFGISPSKTMYPLVLVCIVCYTVLPLSSVITQCDMFNGYLEAYGVKDYTLTPMDFTYARLPLAIFTLIWAFTYGLKIAPEKPVIPIEVVSKKKEEKKPLNPFSETMGVVIFFGTIILMITSNFHGIPTWQISTAGAILTVLCGVLTEKEAIKALPLSMSFIYVGSLAMATALTNTGAGDIIGSWLSNVLMGTQNGYLIGGAFFIVTFIITQFMLNKAVYAIFIPIAILTCQALGANPLGPVLLAFSGSMSAIMTPMATPAIPMAMGAGGYDQKSLLKQGWLLSIILNIGYIAWVMTIYPAF
ncbi:MAG TPA: anion permease [Candidatus Enterocloster faecavium]|uniref:Anion permease n=1 Tax=Candidatus Enterocloster faecavium TaxID=2838560 RepID=A0A9D2RLS0_9FIRM|nr:anion permease [Candidatus Enterocloster faecavium]